MVLGEVLSPWDGREGVPQGDSTGLSSGMFGRDADQCGDVGGGNRAENERA